ncbi:MAG: hypothetical protein WKF31_01875 [Thermoleophilaceae bacterium]
MTCVEVTISGRASALRLNRKLALSRTELMIQPPHQIAYRAGSRPLLQSGTASGARSGSLPRQRSLATCFGRKTLRMGTNQPPTAQPDPYRGVPPLSAGRFLYARWNQRRKSTIVAMMARTWTPPTAAYVLSLIVTVRSE